MARAQSSVQYYGTGRRKNSTARVFLRPGKGRMFINEREVDHDFPRETHRLDLMRPLVLTNQNESYDAFVTVDGGGISGQCGAVRLGLARALLQANPQWRDTLKKAGLLTRDAREVERKKYGRAGARRSFQFSKR
jgi:small subunit ribosomal protein S9